MEKPRNRKGSADSTYLSVQEAAKILNISITGLRQHIREGFLPVYQSTTKTTYLLRDEVLAFAEFRTDSRYNREQLTHIASVAYYRATRAEKHLADICQFLSLPFEKLGETRDAVMQLYTELAEALNEVSPAPKDMTLVGQLLSVSEGYFALTFRYLGDESPWLVYLTVADHIAKKYTKNTIPRMFAESAIRHIKACAFLYVQALKGPAHARDLFQESTYTAQLAHRIQPPFNLD